MRIDKRQLSRYMECHAIAKAHMPIRSIFHKGLWLLYEEDDARCVPPASADKLRDVLSALAAAKAIDELSLVPGWELDALRGELPGRWSPTVARKCWLIFRFEDGDAFELDLVDDP